MLFVCHMILQDYMVSTSCDLVEDPQNKSSFQV